MRPTERTRERTPPSAPPRPAERLFTTRELLLTTWDERRQMTPAAEVAFDYEKTLLRLQFHNARRDINVATAIAYAERKAGLPDPENLADATPFPRRRRKRPYDPAL